MMRCSSGIGVATVAPTSPYSGPTVSIEFVSPLRLLLLATAGGLLGAALKRKARQRWPKTLLVGAATGVLMFIAYALGFNWLPGGRWGGSMSPGGEAMTFFISALGALVGIAQLPGIVKKTWDRFNKT